MAKSKAQQQRESNAALGTVICLLVFVPFLLFTFMRFHLLKNQYLKSDTAVRIVDLAGIKGILASCAAYILFSWLGLGIVADNSKFLGFLLFILLLGLGILLAMRLAIIYLGAVVDDESNTIIFPPDFQSLRFSDYLSIKLVESFYMVDSVELSAISKITREAGKNLYIHGGFGSRKLAFSSKQKRDECIATIQAAENYNGEVVREVGFAQ